jgi:RimJ/RimL family protein N-acetyltransferase
MIFGETGWMILPAFQGKGIAGSALQMILDRARADGRYEQIHAFPSISNVPSNAMCRKFGFSLIEECELEYQGRKLRSNHWRLDLG